jgi:catechol 2,3-dioxygenase-like lactoylglutathione lyase family enzyme
MKLRPMLQVEDVAASRAWYEKVLGLQSRHGGDEFDMLFSGDDFVLQLHRLDAHEHGVLLANTDAGAAGAGMSMWFETDDVAAFDALVGRIRAADVPLAEEPHWNPLAHHHEAALLDPDGYVVMLHSPFDIDGPTT